MVICSNCGSEVENSAFCPSCGNKLVVEKQQNFCPNCNSEVGDSNFCPNCGTKIEKTPQISFCPACGVNLNEDDVFCPNCGTKIINEDVEKYCPSCGKLLNDSSKFCPYCGYSEDNSQDDTLLDNVIDADDKISGIFAKGLSKSRLLDKVHDKTASRGLKSSKKGFNSADRKYWQKTEPVFLEVYDSIDDDFVKVIFWLERNKLGGAGSSVAGLVAASILTPTKDMSHDEAIQFYQNMLNKVKQEINMEKQKGTFDEEEFYKNKFKESTIANSSSFAIPTAVKSWHKNKK